MPRVPRASCREGLRSSPKARPMAAATSGLIVGASAAESGLRSELIFVASPSSGRSFVTVQPNPRVYQAFWVDSERRICDVLDFPASLT